MAPGGTARGPGRRPGGPSRAATTVPKDLVRPLALSLEDLYNGCTKKLKVTRRSMDSSHQIVQSEKILTVDVKPGWKAGTKIRYAKEGDDFGNGAQDIVFVIEEKPHPVFKRQGDDLHMTIELSLVEALCGFQKPVKTLSGRTIRISSDKVVQPDSNSYINDEGMPISKQPGKRGKIVVTYKVKFPNKLNQSQMDAIRNALSSSSF